jgi:hypothetical protein
MKWSHATERLLKLSVKYAESQNVESQNVESQNVESQNVESQNVESQNVNHKMSIFF